MLDVEKFVDGLHDYIGRALRPIAIRLDALEKRQPEKGDPGRDGQDGVVDYLEIQSLVNKAVANIPAPKDGVDGKDGTNGVDGKDGLNGKDAEPVNYEFVIAEAVKQIPIPKDGKDGLNGSDGENGRDGLNGKDADPVDYERVIAEVTKAIPIPENGKDGKDADHNAIVDEVCERALQAVASIPKPRDGIDGKDADQAAILAEVTQKALQAVAEIPKPTNGVNGKDGHSVTLDDVRPMLESELSKWALDFERRAAGVLERAVERIPRPKDGDPGKDGSDGLGFDDFDIDYDGERTCTLKWTAGDKQKSRSIKWPTPIYRGVYKSGDPTEWEAYDMLTYGGSLWMAKQDNPGPPGSASWQLIVKRGADGKDAK